MSKLADASDEFHHRGARSPFGFQLSPPPLFSLSTHDSVISVLRIKSARLSFRILRLHSTRNSENI